MMNEWRDGDASVRGGGRGRGALDGGGSGKGCGRAVDAWAMRGRPFRDDDDDDDGADAFGGVDAVVARAGDAP